MEQRDAAFDGFDGELACRHHWIIDAPSGPTSNGVCRKCGEAREFRNSLPDPPRDDDAFSHFYGKDSFASRYKGWDGDRDHSFSTDGYE